QKPATPVPATLLWSCCPAQRSVRTSNARTLRECEGLWHICSLDVGARSNRGRKYRAGSGGARDQDDPAAWGSAADIGNLACVKTFAPPFRAAYPLPGYQPS